MTTQQAKTVAQQLGEIQQVEDQLQAEIRRLNRQTIVTLKQVEALHNWLEDKRQSKQSCRVVGESRTGKTVACNAYRLRHKPIQTLGKPPIVPVVYIQINQEWVMLLICCCTSNYNSKFISIDKHSNY